MRRVGQKRLDNVMATAKAVKSSKNPKDDVLRLVQDVPDDVTYEDIQYDIYVRQKVKRGLEALTRGDTLTQEDVDTRLARWLGE